MKFTQVCFLGTKGLMELGTAGILSFYPLILPPILPSYRGLER